MRQSHVYMNGVLSGLLQERKDDRGVSYVFTYDESYLSAKGIPISVIMPVRALAYESKLLHSFFNGLIPEGWLLNLAARKFGIETKDRMGLLLSLCENTIGAAEIRNENTLKMSPIIALESEPPNDSELRKFPSHSLCLGCLLPLAATGHNRNYHAKCSKELFGRDRPPFLKLSSDAFETAATDNLTHKLSLTGVQAKFSAKIRYTSDSDSSARTLTLSPEYIFKPEPIHSDRNAIDYRGLAKLELFSLVLASRLGLPTAKSGLLYVEGGQPVFVSRRFDRSSEGKIHVEDFSQILDRTFGDDKYAGSLEQIMKAISQYSHRYRAQSLENFFKLCIFNYLIGNADNHNKNFSLIIAADKTKSIESALSPFYDIIPTALFTTEDDQETALTIAAKHKKLTREHFAQLATRVAKGEELMQRFIDDFKNQGEFIQKALEGLIFPKEKSAAMIALIEERLSRF